ncbi:MAG: MaoC family dehydratase N-terminal domain-containing protein [Proteobacteria bacterium]|nr:MaoC family dehydratase N-terminal domain-containing protein [Pseudomonadota bacterium]
MSQELDIEAMKSQFLNEVFDVQHFVADAKALADYAAACGETAPQFTDPSHPDFQAPPTFASSFHAGRRMPENFPTLPGLGMDAGKAVQSIKPIRPGVTLTGKSHMHDIYTKTGRSGRMVFFVIRMEIFDESDTQLASADTSVVIRERPST